MRTRTNSLAVLVGLIAVGLAAGQSNPPPKQAVKPDPNSLEGMIAMALKNNPDILLAESKVTEATAALNQARSKVIQAVAMAHGARQVAQVTAQLLQDLSDKQSELNKT